MSRGDERVYELTVAGQLGPVLRGVFPYSSCTTVETLTLRIAEAPGRSLADVVALVEAAGGNVHAVHRLRPGAAPSVTAQGSPVPDDAERLPSA